VELSAGPALNPASGPMAIPRVPQTLNRGPSCSGMAQPLPILAFRSGPGGDRACQNEIVGAEPDGPTAVPAPSNNSATTREWPPIQFGTPIGTFVVLPLEVFAIYKVIFIAAQPPPWPVESPVAEPSA